MTQSDKEDLTRVMWPASHTSYGYFTKFGGNLTTDKNVGNCYFVTFVIILKDCFKDK